MRINPNVAWPALIIGLIFISFGYTFAVVYFSNSDGGPQVIENYYAASSTWDATARELAQSEALGWNATFALPTTQGGPEGFRLLRVDVQDASGNPVQDLAGMVRITRPQYAQEVASLPLQVTETPGRYEMWVPVTDAGLWDISLRTLGETPFVARHRAEVFASR